MPIKKKKSQKTKISGTPSIKEVFAGIKHPAINNFIEDLANIVGSTCFQSARDQANYEDHTFAYHYRFFLIFYGFNQAKLDISFFISLPLFYDKYNRDDKKALRDASKSVNYHVKHELITNITAKANLWLKTFVRNNYHDKYHLIW